MSIHYVFSERKDMKHVQFHGVMWMSCKSLVWIVVPLAKTSHESALRNSGRLSMCKVKSKGSGTDPCGQPCSSLIMCWCCCVLGPTVDCYLRRICIQVWWRRALKRQLFEEMAISCLVSKTKIYCMFCDYCCEASDQQNEYMQCGLRVFCVFWILTDKVKWIIII